MFYSGKFLDPFAMAFSQLLADRGLSAPPFVDCAGLRCFGVQAGGAIKTWFRPMIPVPEAVSALAEALGIELRCEKIQVEHGIPDRSRGAVLGPLHGGIAVPEMRDYYYQGEGAYLFVRRLSKTEAELFDPRGYPGLRVRDSQWKSILRPQTAYCIWMGSASPPEISCDLDYALRRGLRYHARIQARESADLERAAASYSFSRNHAVSLQYGVMNFLQQMDRVFHLASVCGALGAGEEARYIKEKQRLYALGREPVILELPQIVGELWGSLNDGR